MTIRSTAAGKRDKPLQPPAAGLAARRAAAVVLNDVLANHRALDDALAHAQAREQFKSLQPRDRAFARLIIATVLRRLGQLDAILGHFLAKPLPEKRGNLREILLSSAAQLLFLATPPHAAISLAVDLCKADRNAARFAGLVNAVLRRVAREGPGLLAKQDAALLNTPEWLMSRWISAFGAARARAIAERHLTEPPLDITIKTGAVEWASRMGGHVLPSGSIRIVDAHGPIESLPGYDEGEWWVQDAAAALPARLLGATEGVRVADLCAAPGGKTAQLAAAGALITAVELSEDRLPRLKQNLERLRLKAELVNADAACWEPAVPFDAVLLDAPCSATGTIRRHPDIPWLKRPTDIAALSASQHRLLANAAGTVRPGGKLVYCTCSLEREEGSEQIARFLSDNPGWSVSPIDAAEIGAEPAWITVEGFLRTVPSDGFPGFPGLDGFFAARLLHSR